MCEKESSLSHESIYKRDWVRKTRIIAKENDQFSTTSWKILRICNFSSVYYFQTGKIQRKDLKTLFYWRSHKATSFIEVCDNSETIREHNKRPKISAMEIGK